MKKVISLVLALSLSSTLSVYANTNIIYSPNIVYANDFEYALLQSDADFIEIEDNSFPYIESLPLSYDEQKIIYDLWTSYGYDYATCLGLMDVETGGTFNKNSYNKNSGDYGLFQLNKRSWFSSFKRLFGINSMSEMYNVELNTRGALYVYSDCVNQYGQTEKALVAYNTGTGKYGSTSYSRKCLRAIAKWQGVLNSL